MPAHKCPGRFVAGHVTAVGRQPPFGRAPHAGLDVEAPDAHRFDEALVGKFGKCPGRGDT